jgi:multidrug efflux pump subunit AcrB
VVDDAIMVLENIVRHRDMGKPRRQAALNGAEEISFAAMAATFSVVAIFLPVAFMEGIIGRYFFQFGVTISVAVLLSLIEALSLTPMRSSLFLEEHEGQDRWIDRVFDRARAAYVRAVTWVLGHRALVLGASAVVFAGGFVLMAGLKKEMLPPQDQSRFLVRLSLPTGTSLNVTDELTKRAEAWLAGREEVLRYYVAVGGFGGGDVNTAVMFVTLKPKGERPIAEAQAGPAPKDGPAPKAVTKRLSQMEFAAVTRANLSKLDPKLRVSVQDLSQRGFATGRGYPVEFSVRGKDWDTLVLKAEELLEAMREDPILVDVDSDYRAGQRDLRVIPDREAAARLGVSMEKLGGVIGSLVGGRIAGKFSEGGRRNDVRVRLMQDARSKPEDILRLSVRNNRGELVRLSQLVKLEPAPSLQTIRRVNRERAITLYANAAPGAAAETALSRALELSRQALPDGYRAVVTGSSQAAQDTTRQLWGALLLGVVIAYMILASQFNSFIHPITVLLAMPFSFTGAFAALALFGQSLNIYSFIGLILLMGLVKKNSILLVDVTNQFRAKGMDPVAALKAACPLRLRPIIMTSMATIAGAVPAASLGAGSETLRPMGIAIIGGMALSTLLTLFVVPAAYSLLARFERNAPVSLEPDAGGAPALKLSRRRKRG